jgi:integrase
VERVGIEADRLGSARRENVERGVGLRSAARLRLGRVGPTGPHQAGATGNLKAVQKLLGHASIQTTGDIYTDWDVEQLAESLMQAVEDDA